MVFCNFPVLRGKQKCFSENLNFLSKGTPIILRILAILRDLAP